MQQLILHYGIYQYLPHINEQFSLIEITVCLIEFDLYIKVFPQYSDSDLQNVND